MDSWQLAQSVIAAHRKNINDADSMAKKPKIAVVHAQSRNLIEQDRMRARSISDIICEMDMPSWKDDPILVKGFSIAQNAINFGRRF